MSRRSIQSSRRQLRSHSLTSTVVFQSSTSRTMAAFLALKRLVSSNAVPTSTLRLFHPASSSASRLFNTNAIRHFDDDDDHVADRRSSRTLPRRRDDFVSDIVDPFWPTRNLSQVLNMMDQFMDNPFRGSIGAGFRRGWDAQETDDGLNLRVEMPGLGKEDVKVSVEGNILVIKAEGPKESEDEESGRRYTGRIDLPEKTYSTDQIKAEMKNGVLKVVVPKVKEEERNNVFHVQVE